jgi:hypothetical protein
MQPKTPKERADNLRAIGAKVIKLPSFKRSEFEIECPRCGCIAAWTGNKHAFVSRERAESMSKTFSSKRSLAIVDLGDVTWHKGGPWERTFYGHDKWLEFRLHILTCSAGELDDDRRASAVRRAHDFMRGLRAAPEVAGLALRELADVLESWNPPEPAPPADWIKDPEELGARRAAVEGAVSLLRRAGTALNEKPLPHLPSATKEARTKAKAADDARMRAGTQEMLKGMRQAIEGAGKPK